MERPGQGCMDDNLSHQFWVMDWVLTLLHGESRSFFPPWQPCSNKLPAAGFPPGCEQVSVTDAWSHRSWRKRSRTSMRPPISRACSTSSSSVRTTTCSKLAFACLGPCSVKASPRYLHVSPLSDQAPRRALGTGRGEGVNVSVRVLKTQT